MKTIYIILGIQFENLHLALKSHIGKRSQYSIFAYLARFFVCFKQNGTKN